MIKKTKIIGLTPRVCHEDGVKKQAVNETYVDAVCKMGFTPIMLTLNCPDYEAILSLCDGFVVTGGVDLDPKYFHQENKGSEVGDPAMDIVDKIVVEWAVKHKVPMLGICRGHQSINVFMGGDLIQDIGTSHKNTRHMVQTYPNRYFDFPKVMEINSYHHQVLDHLAEGLIPIATSNEGYNEAFIHESLPIISFQWHPEKVPGEESSKIIFNKFKELVNEQ